MWGSACRLAGEVIYSGANAAMSEFNEDAQLGEVTTITVMAYIAMAYIVMAQPGEVAKMSYSYGLYSHGLYSYGAARGGREDEL